MGGMAEGVGVGSPAPVSSAVRVTGNADSGTAKATSVSSVSFTAGSPCLTLSKDALQISV